MPTKMSDAFWNNLPAILGSLGTIASVIIAALVTGYVTIKKIDYNTIVTEKGQRKTEAILVDTAAQTTNAAAEAAHAVAGAEIANKKIVGNSAAIKEEISQIKHQLNGVRSEELQREREIGYSQGIIEGTKMLTKIDEHDNRILRIEGRLEHVEKDTKETLALVKELANREKI